mgnify:CR=1 FL=1|tara:strand:- start:1936 stop:2493 length:558 start_codon:yes stop_codon:yes gene_type:complete
MGATDEPIKQTEEQKNAKGLYTFTATEKIEHIYGVVAASWDEAKQHMENHNYIKLNNGDHYGGSYIGESEPRRFKLKRKTSCVGAKFSFTKTEVKWGSGDEVEMITDAGCLKHPNAILINEHDEYEGHSYQTWDDESEVRILSVDSDTGLCECCSNLLRRGWAMIPPKTATHTAWGQPLDSGDEE